MTKLTEEQMNAKTVYASGCTGLTELAAPNAEYVDASGCTGLTELAAPNAEYVYASGCTGLTELAAPNAEYVDASGCTGLAEKFQSSGDMEKFLTGGGKTLAEVCAPEHWNCHEWTNCPTAAAYNGANCISQLPADKQFLGSLFISLFDAGLLKNPLEDATKS